MGIELNWEIFPKCFPQTIEMLFTEVAEQGFETEDADLDGREARLSQSDSVIKPKKRKRRETVWKRRMREGKKARS